MDRKERRELVKLARREAKKKTALGWAWTVIKWAIITVMVAVIAALLVVPRALGGTSLTILSSSMVPTFNPGDIIAVKSVDPSAVCDTVSIGDIVTFMPEPDDPTLITHRVIDVQHGPQDDTTRCRLITMGDANSAVDKPVSPDQVRATHLYTIPKFGWVRQWVGNALGAHKQEVLYAGAGLLIVYGLATLIMPRTKTRVVVVEEPETPESAYYWTI